MRSLVLAPMLALVVLAASTVARADVVFTEPMSGGLVGDAEKKVLELIPRIEKGIFWPPGTGPNPPWKYDYADWLMPTPQDAVDEDWIADQERRLVEAAT